MYFLRGFVLALHIFGVIFWMGGLLMVTSLLARVPEEVGLPKERFLGAARGLFESTVNLGAAISIILGLLLTIIEPAVLRQGWLHAKLLLVAILLFYHVRFYRRIKFLENNPSQSTSREFRVIHGMVSALLIAILVLTVIKPF
jgi:protoporphyrinogen IX oxidase